MASRSSAATGSGRNNSASATVTTAVAAPMPIARVTTAIFGKFVRTRSVIPVALVSGHACATPGYAPTACRKLDGVWLVCFLNASLNVDLDSKPALERADDRRELDPVERETRHRQQDTGGGESSQSGEGSTPP